MAPLKAIEYLVSVPVILLLAERLVILYVSFSQPHTAKLEKSATACGSIRNF